MPNHYARSILKKSIEEMMRWLGYLLAGLGLIACEDSHAGRISEIGDRLIVDGRKLKEYGFVDDSLASGRELRFLAYSPRSKERTLPMLVCFAGSGETGYDVAKLLRQKRLFDVLLSSSFQREHQCFVLCPLLPPNETIHGGIPERPTKFSLRIKSLIDECCRTFNRPSVDTARIYVTGYSYGGALAFEFPCYFPTLFAASVPISSFMNSMMVPDKMATKYWLLYNKTSLRSEEKINELSELSRRIALAGGEFKSSVLPGVGHNAWDCAWREPNVWKWMFSQSLEGRSMRSVIRCETNVPYSKEEGVTPMNPVDGLESTLFISCGLVGRGSYWMCEFDSDMKGRWVVDTSANIANGLTDMVRVYVSSDEEKWRLVGRVRKSDGRCDFTERKSFKYIKVLYEGEAEGLFSVCSVRKVQ